jgi:alkylation response protein AidB-like acyl-CoA dehydrogenase
MKVFNFSRPNIAAQALGIAQAPWMRPRYVSNEFSSVDSGVFQGMQWMLAEMALSVETARSIVYRSGAMIDSDPVIRISPTMLMAKCMLLMWR